MLALTVTTSCAFNNPKINKNELLRDLESFIMHILARQNEDLGFH